MLTPWRRAVILADNAKSRRAIVGCLQTLIQRLYHEDDIRLFDAQDVVFIVPVRAIMSQRCWQMPGA